MIIRALPSNDNALRHMITSLSKNAPLEFFIRIVVVFSYYLDTQNSEESEFFVARRDSAANAARLRREPGTSPV